jgi:hypothetical protein
MLACRSQEDDGLQVEFEHIQGWAAEHGMQLNVQKTKILDFKTSSVINPSVIVDGHSGTVVESLSSAKLLGITLSINMKWNEHVSDICKRARKRLFLLLQLRRGGVSTCVLVQFYNAVIRPLLCYAYPAMCNMPCSLFSSIQRIETRAFKMIGCKPAVDLEAFTDKLCRSLLTDVARKEGHPLRVFFSTSGSHGQTRRSARLAESGRSIEPPFARTSRFKDWLIKYA